jgi:glucose-1-phosphate thymidylyltransferase
MKGIILAGGHGTRLHPLTLGVSKQLLPVYDKPMICYPLSVLIECGIREIAIIIKPREYDNFVATLGNGQQWGVRIEYHFQVQPNGIADAFVIASARDFIGYQSVALILGDNIFTNAGPIVTACKKFNGTGAAIIGYDTATPERYGVMCFDSCGRLSAIEEKPKVPKSSYAVTGVYFYDNTVVAKAKNLKPSARGELEITDINNRYIEDGQMQYAFLTKPKDHWLDAGTPDDLHWASSLIRSQQLEKGRKIGCPDEAAKRRDEAEAK